MATETPFNPYLGPRPFESTPQDIARFFGRTRENRDVISLIIAQRTLVIYGKSGTGKTSLLNAGIIPSLEQQELDVRLRPARVQGIIAADTLVGSQQNIYMYNVLAGWVNPGEDTAGVSQMALADFLAKREPVKDQEGDLALRVVIFDQFEELFTAYPRRWEDREGFFRQVRDALKADDLLRVVFVMREDYIAELDRYAGVMPSGLQTRFRLERLGRDSALQAIVRPLDKTPRKFAPGAGEYLVDELLAIRDARETGLSSAGTDEFVEPVVLQVVCESLWKSLPAFTSEITIKDVGQYARVDNALVLFYEDCIQSTAKASKLGEEQIRDWFEMTLITSAGTRGTVYQGAQTTGGLPNEAVEMLENKHIIRGEQRANARWFELAHDRFIQPIRRSNEAWRTDKAEKKYMAAVLSPGAVNDTVAADDPALLAAWRRLIEYDAVAVRGKQAYRRIQYGILLFGLLLAVTAVLVTAFTSTLEMQSLLTFALVIFSALFAVLVLYRDQFSGSTNWIEFRTAAELVRSEIYQYRMSAGPYYRESPAAARRELLRQINRVDARTDTALPLTEISSEDLRRRILMSTLSGGDDGLSPLPLEEYIRWRVTSQINWYIYRIQYDYAALRRFRLLMLGAASAGVVLAGASAVVTTNMAFILQALIPISTVLTLSLPLLTSTRTYGTAYDVYQETANELQSALNDWYVREEVNPYTISEFVMQMERIIQYETEMWRGQVMRAAGSSAGEVIVRTEERMAQAASDVAYYADIAPIPPPDAVSREEVDSTLSSVSESQASRQDKP